MSNPSLTSSLKTAYVAGLTLVLRPSSALASGEPVVHAVKKGSSPLFWLALGAMAVAFMVVFIRRASKGLTMRIRAPESKSSDKLEE